MATRDLVMSAAGGQDKTYIEDVFSTYLYTGNGSTQTINNGIDLAGKGGMVWLKGRSGATDHALYDTARGATYDLVSNSTAAQTTQSTGLTAFNSNGFSIGALAKLNTNAATYASWTFRKAPKFFDVVTWTGDGVNNRAISHSLGQTPGMIIVKCTNTGPTNWWVWHRALATGTAILLNSTDAAFATSEFPTPPNASSFFVRNTAQFNAIGSTYVAYLFAHDTTTDGLIQCGSFTTDGSGVSALQNLGYEPQFILVKRSDNSFDGNWQIHDVIRGWSNTSLAILYPNLSNAEVSALNQTFFTIHPNGFQGVTGQLQSNATYIYMAIRRPMKVPTDGTKVFSPITRQGTGAAATVSTVGFAPDTVITFGRTLTYGDYFTDRLRGNATLTSQNTNAEATYTAGTAIELNQRMDGFYIGSGNTNFNNASYNYINWNFRRAPGFFDVVCYTGTGVYDSSVNHNLSVVPELIIIKSRSNSGTGYRWFVQYGNSFGSLNLTDAFSNIGWTTPTPTTFTAASGLNLSTSGVTFVAYLFASCPGVSKVGSYTGNGSSQTINCGFAAGARFVLIKRTDSTGDWYVWDTARGIVASNDPHLSLNTTAAEVTTNDTIDPDSSGFIVNQVSATNVNVNAASYIYLAIA